MPGWSRKANDARDLLIRQVILDCRKTVNRRGENAVYRAAQKVLAEKHEITFDDHGGLVKAFYRAWRLERGRLIRKKVGAKGTPDVVGDYVIYSDVCAALRDGKSLNQAYRAASVKDPLHRSSGAIRAIFEKMVKAIESRPQSRLNDHRGLIKPR